MSEPALIQQERELLRTLREVIAQRDRAEAEAAARLKREQEDAEATLNRRRQYSEGLMEEIRGLAAWAKEFVGSQGSSEHKNQPSQQVPVSDQQDNWDPRLTKHVLSMRKLVEELKQTSDNVSILYIAFMILVVFGMAVSSVMTSNILWIPAAVMAGVIGWLFADSSAFGGPEPTGIEL